MSKEYHKINTIFKRDMAGDKKLIVGAWSTPEFEYLQDSEWEFTEKVDGTNIRVSMSLIDDYLSVQYAGRTDNAMIPEALLLALEELFPIEPVWRRNLDRPPYRDKVNQIKEWMNDCPLESVTLYGEGYGPKIQSGGGNYRKDAGFVLFDVKIGDFWLYREDVEDVAAALGIDVVPVVGYGTLGDAVDMVKDGMVSTWGSFQAEGIVIRPTVALFNRKGERIIAKVKVKDFE